MGEPFDGVRNSTVGADKMVLEVRQTTTKTLDLQRAEASSLMERAVRTAAADKPAASQTSIGKMVATNAGRAEVGSVSVRAAEVSSLVIDSRCKHWRMCCMPMRLTCGCNSLEQARLVPKQAIHLDMAVFDDQSLVWLDVQ
jgi:hypothetical protein